MSRVQQRIREAEARVQDLRQRQASLEAHLRLAEEERDLLRGTLEALREVTSWAAAGEALHRLVQRPFGISGFYLAHADLAQGLITFPYFFEAGRARELPPVPLDVTSGLTGRALLGPRPLYLSTQAACEAAGMRLTPSEIQSGLLTKSWFGIPLASAQPGAPAGLMAFHSLQAEAFPPERRHLMETVAALAALHLA